ncbi:hypothetical protein AB1Y20_007739 [Prymnesium parvum]|uniref:FERM domain-containing protein n=1 Tax=Prymnesium parvum TaxID=97485 RepID=A0AB34IYF3_PRYPA
MIVALVELPGGSACTLELQPSDDVDTVLCRLALALRCEPLRGFSLLLRGRQPSLWQRPARLAQLPSSCPRATWGMQHTPPAALVLELRSLLSPPWALARDELAAGHVRLPPALFVEICSLDLQLSLGGTDAAVRTALFARHVLLSLLPCCHPRAEPPALAARLLQRHAAARRLSPHAARAASLALLSSAAPAGAHFAGALRLWPAGARRGARRDGCLALSAARLGVSLAAASAELPLASVRRWRAWGECVQIECDGELPPLCHAPSRRVVLRLHCADAMRALGVPPDRPRSPNSRENLDLPPSRTTE